MSWRISLGALGYRFFVKYRVWLKNINHGAKLLPKDGVHVDDSVSVLCERLCGRSHFLV